MAGAGDGIDMPGGGEPTHHHDALVSDYPLPGGVELNTAAYGAGAIGSFLLGLVALVKRRRRKAQRDQLDD